LTIKNSAFQKSISIAIGYCKLELMSFRRAAVDKKASAKAFLAYTHAAQMLGVTFPPERLVTAFFKPSKQASASFLMDDVKAVIVEVSASCLSLSHPAWSHCIDRAPNGSVSAVLRDNLHELGGIDEHI
jgi:hypothetical protein